MQQVLHLITNNASVTGTLTLTSGVVTTGANTLMVTNNAVGAIVRTNGDVAGNLQRAIAGAGNLTYNFPLGTATSYTPVSVAFTGLSGAGNLTAKVTPGQNPNGGSPINPTKDVNLYWTFTNAGVTFTSYTPTFTYNAGDIIGGATQTNFIVGKYTPPWSSPAPVTNAGAGPYTTSVTGLTSFSDFVVGEILGCSITLTSGPGSNIQNACLNKPMTNITYGTAVATGATVTGLPPGVTGVWASDVVTISGTPTTTVGSPFNYTVTLTGGGCSDIATGTITVNPLPVPTIGGSNTVCEITLGYLYTTQAGMTNYSWSVSPQGTIVAGGGPGDNTVTIDWNTAGAASVSVNYADGIRLFRNFTYSVSCNCQSTSGSVNFRSFAGLCDKWKCLYH